MFFSWFDTRMAVRAGLALADGFAKDFPEREAKPGKDDRKLAGRREKAVKLLFVKANAVGKQQRFNMYQRARLGQAFQKRLIELGYAADVAQGLTQDLLVRLT